MPEPVTLPRIVKAVAETPWAITPEMLGVILDIVSVPELVRGLRLDDDLDEHDVGGEPAMPERGKVAVVELRGTILPRLSGLAAMSGGMSLERLQTTLRELDADTNVDTIVLDIDSPGGTVTLVEETADVIRSLNTRTVAVANGMAASAAYWLATAADELVVTPSGEVGSIGVWTAHTDISAAERAAGRRTTLIRAGKYKIEGHPFGPLSDEAKANMQERVDAIYDRFVADVAAGRNTTDARVRERFGQGRMVMAQDALARGMVDRVAPLAEVLAGLSASPQAIAAAASLDRSWMFDNPMFGTPGEDKRLRYDPDAQKWSCPPTLVGDHFFGHVAPMGVCLRGRPQTCITPPDADLEGFMRAYAPAAGGLRTGVIQVGGSHADVGVGVVEATKHYDKTGRAGADVRVGRDAYGVWFSGMIRPGCTEADRYALAASDVSGHWEMGQRGRPVLVGLPAVNVGGYPKGYLTAAEVAAGLAAAASIDEDCGCDDGHTDRLSRLERQMAEIADAVLTVMADDE